jgi:tol-pal system protein YbgF
LGEARFVSLESHNSDAGLRKLVGEAHQLFQAPFMTSLPPAIHRALLIASAVAALGAPAASAQSNGDQSPGFLGGLFGGGGADQDAHRDRPAQNPANDLSVRIDRLEAQIRQMTGVIEELQFRNQQLTDQLKRLQGDGGAQSAVAQQSQPSGRQPPLAQAAQQTPAPQPSAQPPRPTGPQPSQVALGTPPTAAPPSAPPSGGRRGDAFDPSQNPNAPGAPRTLGTMPSGTAAGPANPDQVAAEELPPAGGRAAGEPLNLGADAGYGPQGGPPPGDGRGTQVATLPPSDSPKDYYDMASGYMVRKDYALAEDAFRAFLRKFPSDRMAADAEFYLGESMFARQRYRDAAEAFLNVSTKYESAARAPDALLRLGQSLAFLGEKEAACASLGEVLRKYPRAALAVKQGVDREQKRDGC